MSIARAHHSAAPAAPAGGARFWIPSAFPVGNVLESKRGWGCGNLAADPKQTPVQTPDSVGSADRTEISARIQTARPYGPPPVPRDTLASYRRLRRLNLAAGAVALLWCAAGAVWAETPLMGLPSGTQVTLHEVLLDPTPTQGTDAAPWARFRFVAPELRRDGTGQTHADAAADMDHLCSALVRPYLELHQLTPARVVISLADRPVPFGQAAPDVSQFFESYRLVDGACVWEGY